MWIEGNFGVRGLEDLKGLRVDWMGFMVRDLGRLRLRTRIMYSYDGIKLEV